MAKWGSCVENILAYASDESLQKNSISSQMCFDDKGCYVLSALI